MFENVLDGAIKIMYLHGYGSRFDLQSEKMHILSQLGEVVGPDLNYGLGPDVVRKVAEDLARQEFPDLIVGTSMGGWLAGHTGTALGIPFVALNPAIRPSQTLRKYIGNPVNYEGFEATIEAETVAAYPDFRTTKGFGLILCEEADEVLDAHTTIAFLKDYYDARLIPGGNHRFSSLADHLGDIHTHWFHSVMCYEDPDSD